MVGRGVWGLEGAGGGLGEDSGERSEDSGAVGSRGRWGWKKDRELSIRYLPWWCRILWTLCAGVDLSEVGGIP